MKRKDWIARGFLLPLAMGFVGVCSFSTVRRCVHPFYADSYLFQVVGKYWAAGRLPYVELWDSKGPGIFFADMLGYAVAGRAGLILLQVISLFATMVIFYEMFREVMKPARAYVWCAVMLAALMMTYEGGNNVEEYILPFLALSMKRLVEWGWSTSGKVSITKSKPTTIDPVPHDPRAAFLYGVTIGLCAFSRATNFLGVAGAVLIIMASLAVSRMWRNLLQNLLAGILGIAAATVPFIAYFAAKGALWEMFYGTFIYNMAYAASSSASINMKKMLLAAVGYAPAAALLVWALARLILTRGKCFFESTMWLLAAGLPLNWLMKSNHYLHYGMIVYPYLAVLVVEVDKSVKKKHSVARAVVICFCLIEAAGGWYRFHSQTTAIKAVETAQENDENSYDLYAAEDLVRRNISQIEMTKFTAYNCNPKIYLDLGVCPACRFFAFQDWAVHEGGDDYRDIFLAEYGKCESDWILLKTSAAANIRIRDILAAHYHLVDETTLPDGTQYQLYRAVPVT